jgi:Tfp pilus assembly protein PilE
MRTWSRAESRKSRVARAFCKTQALNSRPSTLDSQRGIALVDCLAYIALLAVILTMAFGAFYRAMEHSRELARNAAEIARALQAGERWRADVRASTQPPRLESVGNESQLRLASVAGEVTYTFRAGGVLRQALPNTNWVELLPRTAESRMFEERRQHVRVWQWEVELKAGQKSARVRPLFSFQAVASRAPTL